MGIREMYLRIDLLFLNNFSYFYCGSIVQLTYFKKGFDSYCLIISIRPGDTL